MHSGKGFPKLLMFCHDVDDVLRGHAEVTVVFLRGFQCVPPRSQATLVFSFVHSMLLRPFSRLQVPYWYSGSSATVIRGRPTPGRGSAIVRRANPGPKCGLARARALCPPRGGAARTKSIELNELNEVNELDELVRNQRNRRKFSFIQDYNDCKKSSFSSLSSFEFVLRL